MVNNKQIEALARKNALQWEQVKQVLKISNKYSKEQLMSMKAKELARTLAQLKKR